MASGNRASPARYSSQGWEVYFAPGRSDSKAFNGKLGNTISPWEEYPGHRLGTQEPQSYGGATLSAFRFR